ncbi:MAG: DUF4918 family protein [Bacteroidales bacterium]|nr:DUF4918 family protein [Bacteroidales bacterium]
MPIPFAEKVIRFYDSLVIPEHLPNDIEVMNPYLDHYNRNLAEAFYRRFYSDNRPRRLILGINPGRFGGGVTGIPFTDPVKLQNECKIPNRLPKRTEPSAGFIYDMIRQYGGTEDFYSRYFISAICPLGLLKNGKNYNYYDSPRVLKALEPFIRRSLHAVCGFGIDPHEVYCLGRGANFTHLLRLNEQEMFFGKIVPLPHPRWVVQYRRNQYQEMIWLYLYYLKTKSSA